MRFLRDKLDLLIEIDKKRKEMYRAMNNDEDTDILYRISRELDLLVTEYIKKFPKKDSSQSVSKKNFYP
ncbi:aspartyl-phosphate phosphatase Spo0E family protein [Heliorestis acidaminivorans]|uniref:Aspartyl-phosphate phosphatase Spo0E family protein n=1 Tax=Heliorestis acidaminivorans TaxID=553427 RepID=A0A6I0EY69_9FIRM|nr:aspartyl-phosphate phosphatase Spo0E family protein [Heliorestis acidaminivorans]